MSKTSFIQQANRRRKRGLKVKNPVRITTFDSFSLVKFATKLRRL